MFLLEIKKLLLIKLDKQELNEIINMVLLLLYDSLMLSINFIVFVVQFFMVLIQIDMASLMKYYRYGSLARTEVRSKR